MSYQEVILLLTRTKITLPSYSHLRHSVRNYYIISVFLFSRINIYRGSELSAEISLLLCAETGCASERSKKIEI